MTLRVHPHPTRLLGRKRVPELHNRARLRMERRARIYNQMYGADVCLSRLGKGGTSLAKHVLKARAYVGRLYEEAAATETRLWVMYPPCEVCEGSGKVRVNEYDMDCGKCSGSGRGS